MKSLGPFRPCRYAHHSGCKSLAVLEFGEVQFSLERDLAFIFDRDGVIVDSNPVHSERVAGITTTHNQFSEVHFTIRDFRDPELLVWLLEERPDALSR